MFFLSTPFKNYIETRHFIPHFFWYLPRLASLGGVAGLVYFFQMEPENALRLFWFVFIPTLPFIFMIAPGLWRNICPMATVNQIPRKLGFSFGIKLNSFMQRWFYILAFTSFLAIVGLRPVYFHDSSFFTTLLLLTAMSLAFLGGLLFRGKSGWCGTLCPMAPIQKLYGQAPLFYIRNGFCTTCVGCQKNCYDFNPRPSLITELSDADEPRRLYKQFFVAVLPGFILAFFTGQDLAQTDPAGYAMVMARNIVFSIGLYNIARTVLPFSLYKLSSAFVISAFFIFYYFVLETWIPNLIEFTTLARDSWVPDWPLIWPEASVLIQNSQYFILGLGGLVFLRALLQEIQFKRSLTRASSIRIHNIKSVKSGLQDYEQGMVVAEDTSGINFPIKDGQTVLMAAEEAGLLVECGCRMGICGADPIAITNMPENVNPPSSEEVETLKKMGLLGKARLACSTYVSGSVGISLDHTSKKALPLKVKKKTDNESLGVVEPMEDEAPFAKSEDPLNKKHIVVIGNGVAGTSLVQYIRARSRHCQITLLSRETHSFYNRMGICRLINQNSDVRRLYLLPPKWFSQNNVKHMLATRVSKLNPSEKSILLANGNVIDYDKLVLAMGARSIIPSLEGNLLSGVFTVRDAEDALDIYNWCKAEKAKNAVVVGGGFQGIEVALALKAMGLEVSIVNKGAHLASRILDNQAGLVLKDFLEKKGIRVLVNSVPDKLVGKSKIHAVSIEKSDSIKTDVCILNVGVTPNIDLVEGTNLKANKGILVDRSMRTSDPDIYAIGDCTEISSVPFGLWGISMDMAKVAAKNLLGEKKEIEASPFSMPYILKESDIDVRSFGRIQPTQEDRTFTRDSSSDEQWWRVVLNANNNVVGGVFVNNTDMSFAMRQAMMRHLDVSGAFGIAPEASSSPGR